jgi:hypothetical protein
MRRPRLLRRVRGGARKFDLPTSLIGHYVKG